MRAQSPVIMDESFPERLDDDREEEFYYNFIDDSPVVGEYSSLFTSQQSTTEYAAAIQLATTPQSTNNPYRFHLEAYKHLVNFMVEFTMENGLVETPVAESPTTRAFYHRPTAVITYILSLSYLEKEEM
jgi:hypothetical protein